MLADILIIFILAIAYLITTPLILLGTFIIDPIVTTSLSVMSTMSSDLFVFVDVDVVKKILSLILTIEGVILLFHTISWFFKRPT